MTVPERVIDRGFDELTFVRTVDRSVLHRNCLSEVFLTDSRPVNASSYLAAAQLPAAHCYYTDHLLRVPLPDPLLLLECSRQAETYGGHAYFNAPRDTKFILLRWSVDLPGLIGTAVILPPQKLFLSITTSDRRGGVGRRLRGLTYHVDLHFERVKLGRVTIEVGYQPAEIYQEVRAMRRGSFPPTSDEILLPPEGMRVAPHLVGRSNPDNVLLTDVVVERDRAVARIRIPVTNRSMFDHSQDHLPGMVLTESARQLCLLAGNDFCGASPTRTTLVGLDASFTDYAELDAPITAIMHREPIVGRKPDLRCRELAGARTNVVTFEQRGATIASAAITMLTLTEPAVTRQRHRQLANAAV